MKDGAWIRVSDGAFWYIDEHANWAKRKENAGKMGLPSTVWNEISTVPNDYVGNHRRRILLTVMAAGFVRMRGRGAVIVFEFTCSTRQAVEACAALLRTVGGPYLLCRFHNLAANELLEITCQELLPRLNGDWKWLQTQVQPLASDASPAAVSNHTETL